jgi:hypothetical protein
VVEAFEGSSAVIRALIVASSEAVGADSMSNED